MSEPGTLLFLCLPLPILFHDSSASSPTSFLHSLILCPFLSLFLLLIYFPLCLFPRHWVRVPLSTLPGGAHIPHYSLNDSSVPASMGPSEPPLPNRLISSVQPLSCPTALPSTPSTILGCRGCCGDIFLLELHLLLVAFVELGLFLERTLLVLSAAVGILLPCQSQVPGKDPSDRKGGAWTCTSPFQPLAADMDPEPWFFNGFFNS